MANNMVKLAEAKATPLESNVNVQVVQIEAATIETESRFKATFKIADDTCSMNVTSYHASHQTMLCNPVPQGMIILNAIVKGYGLVLTSRSILSINKPFAIPEHIMVTTGVSPVKVRAAMGSPTMSLVKIKAKVTKVVKPTEQKEVYSGVQDFAEVRVSDDTATSNLALWGPCCSAATVGTVLQVSNVRVKLFNEKKKLSTTPKSVMELLPTDEETQDWTDDEDMDNADDVAGCNVTGVKQGILLAIISFDPYYACPVPKCNGVKLVSVEVEGDNNRLQLMCRSHNGPIAASSANQSMVAKFVVSTGQGMESVTAFKPIITTLFQNKGVSMPDNLMDRSILQDALADLLPLELKYKLSADGVVQSVVQKRKHD